MKIEFNKVKHDQRIILPIASSLLKQVEVVAVTNGVSKQEVIRKILSKYFNKAGKGAS